MKVKYKSIWLDNVVLFNKCVQESGGIMEITSSWTDPEGDVIVRVCFTKLSEEKEKEYLDKRISKK
jgi:hypothetical protein